MACRQYSSNRGPAGRGNHRRSGQILIITLLAMTLLVGLIFYVYNVGLAVNRRLEMQNAADSAAISGAGWMARSMNVVAMNNVTQSRMIALALVLDSMPLAAEMTVAEETGEDSLPIALQQQLARGVPSTSLERYDFLRRGLEEIHRQMNRRETQSDTHLDLVTLVDENLDQANEREKEGAWDVSEATEWIRPQAPGPAPHGTIWQAAMAADQVSQAIGGSAGVLAQANAGMFGRRSGADTALLTPVQPQIPGFRGTIRDFEPVLSNYIRVIEDPARNRYEHRMVDSRLVQRLRNSDDVLKSIEKIKVRGGGIPEFEWPHRLGPFARTYNWRDYHHRHVNQWWEDDYTVIRIGYSTYGPLEHALRVVLRNFGQMGRHGGIAYTSRFPHHVRKLAKLKLAYLLGLDSPQRIQYADNWMHDFEKAREFAEENPREVLRTRYYRVRVDSAVPWDDPRWLTGQRNERPEERTFWSWQIRPVLSGDITRQQLWRWAWEPWGWRTPPGEKVTDHVWVRKRVRQVRDYRHFNWPPRPIYDAQGNVTGYDLYTLYTVEWYVWGGLEIRDEVDVTNPIEGAHPDNLPAPIILDLDQGDYDPENPHPDAPGRRPGYTFLGAAWRDDTARVWPQRFASRNPERKTLAVAQAKLFNNRSWDLWTQSWDVQLMPVTRWEEWVDQLAADEQIAVGAEGVLIDEEVNPEDVELLRRYMGSLPPETAETYVNH